MQDFRVRLESAVSRTFRCQKAANSLDIDVEKKSIHEFSVSADLETPYNVGLIVGASGSGKTSLARQMFSADCFAFEIDEALPIIDQFPESMDYDACAAMLAGIGLTSVPCWIRPVNTLSTGQRARAIAALQMARRDVFVIDEWTSVVDRTVAKAMSNCLQGFARKNARTVIALSCHYDVTDWLNPDWIIDCNKATYADRRLLWRDFKRSEQLEFEIAETDGTAWRYFSRYHYLSDRLPGGICRYFGLFSGADQIGFICFANYTPRRPSHPRMIMHANRIVIHPDYVGLGLGIRLTNVCSGIMRGRGYDVRCKFSSVPVYRGFQRYPELWRLETVQRDTPKPGGRMERKAGFRRHIKTYSFSYIGAAA